MDPPLAIDPLESRRGRISTRDRLIDRSGAEHVEVLPRIVVPSAQLLVVMPAAINHTDQLRVAGGPRVGYTTCGIRTLTIESAF